MTNIELPTTLISAIQEQRAILFLGAGASYDAVHPRNQKIPSAERLKELICKKYFDGRLMDKPLTSVAAFAAAEVGMPAFQKYVREIFVDFGPADFHLLIPTFRWRAIVTTNFDLIVERAYENCR